MAKTLFIRPASFVGQYGQDTPVSWLLYEHSEQRVFHLEQGCLGDIAGNLAEWEAGKTEKQTYDQMVVLLPGTQVSYKKLKVTKSQLKHISTALPYMVEEEVADDVSGMHFVHRLDGDTIAMAAIRHEAIQQMIEGFGQAGLNPDHIIPELQLLTPSNDCLMLLMESDRTILACPGQTAAVLPQSLLTEAVKAVLEKSLHTEEQHGAPFASSPTNKGIDRVQMERVAELSETQLSALQALKDTIHSHGVLIDELSPCQDFLPELAQRYFVFKGPLDLRAGSYRSERQDAKKFGRWRPLMATAAAGMLIHLGFMVAKGLLLEQKSESYWLKNTEIYLSVYEHDRQVKQARNKPPGTINIKRRLESRLKAVRQEDDSPALLSLLADSSQALASLDNQTVTTQSLDYSPQSNRLVMEFSAGSLKDVDHLLAALKKQGLAAELGSANQENGGANARMVIQL